MSKASVEVQGEISGQIKKGLLVLIGIEDTDTEKDTEWLSSKISHLRIFEDAEGKMNHSVMDVGGDILVVSQFTLFASTKKGHRPSFTGAGEATRSEKFYLNFIEQVKNTLGREVPSGVFGASMKVSLINDGPVTIFIDSQKKE